MKTQLNFNKILILKNYTKIIILKMDLMSIGPNQTSDSPKPWNDQAKKSAGFTHSRTTEHRPPDACSATTVDFCWSFYAQRVGNVASLSPKNCL